MSKRTDRPPILRFLILFAALLCAALALAMLSSAPESAGAEPAARMVTKSGPAAESPKPR